MIDSVAYCHDVATHGSTKSSNKQKCRTSANALHTGSSVALFFVLLLQCKGLGIMLWRCHVEFILDAVRQESI